MDLQIHALKLSDLRGWSMLCEDVVQMVALHIPEEDRCIDIYEVIENEKLLRWGDTRTGSVQRPTILNIGW